LKRSLWACQLQECRFLRDMVLPLSVRCLKRVDFQRLEDKCAGKLPTSNGKYVTMAGRSALVKSAIASQAIYYLTPLKIPPGPLKFIKIERTFFWSAKDTATGAQSRSIRRRCAGLRILEGLGCFTCKNLQQPLGYDVHGFNGRIPIKIGRAPGILVTVMTWKSSMPPLQLHMEIGGRALFGILLGFEGASQSTLHPSSLPLRRESIGRLRKLCMKTLGWERLIWSAPSPSSTSPNSLTFGF
jgi:hypothetical protein